MVVEDKIMRDYLQAAHDRGGGYQMALGMLVSRLLVLEDRLSRLGISVEPDAVVTNRRDIDA